jgi:cyclase
MSRTALSWVCRGLIGAIAAAIATGAGAEDGLPAPTPGNAAVVLGAQLVKTGLYLITGGGSNTLLRLSQSGAILVDGKQAGAYRALMSQVRRISKLSDLPARLVIVTDHHGHHTGNHVQFLAAGMAVIAQQNAKSRLPDGPVPGAKSVGPVVTFDQAYKLRMGGVEVDLHHFGNGHSDNDTVVYFPDMKVVAVGDLYAVDGPEPDFAGGGSLVGWGAVLDRLLTLDFDIAVPSVGPVLTRADLVAFKSKVETLLDRASALLKQGVAKDQLMVQLQTDDLGWRLNFSADQLDRLCADLSSWR